MEKLPDQGRGQETGAEQQTEQEIALAIKFLSVAEQAGDVVDDYLRSALGDQGQDPLILSEAASRIRKIVYHGACDAAGLSDLTRKAAVKESGV